MATRTFTPVLGKRIRATELTRAGIVKPGPAGKNVVTEGFITVELTAEVEDGTEILQRNAAGNLCVNEKGPNSFKYFNVKIDFCGVNPSLVALTTNAEEYTSGSDVIGFVVPEGAIEKWFALELWTGLSGATVRPGEDEASGYMLLPMVAAGTLGDITVDNENAVTFSLAGAITKGGNGWGVGPWNVVYGAGTNEVQRVAITGTPTGGTFTLSYRGQTTGPLQYNTTAAAVATALNSLSTIGTGNVTTTGGPLPGSPIDITFTGSLAGTNVDQLTSTASLTGGTSPAVNVTTTTAGTSSPAKLPTALDPFDHLLLVDTGLAPPAEATSPLSNPT